MGKLASKLKVAIIVAALALNFSAVGTFANQSGLQIPQQVTGEASFNHVYHLSESIGARVAGTAKEIETRDYIVEKLSEMGYEVEIQPFTYTRGGRITFSSNVIATKPGKLQDTVIIGAHYDSVSVRTIEEQSLTGAGDNASGIGVMLEAAQALTNYRTQGTIKFVAFGAEEAGLRGSRYYASQMTEKDVEDSIAMINLDCVGIGDYFYVYSGLDGNPGWVRDLALTIGKGFGHDLRTSPQSEYFDFGTTGDWSDHVPFKNLGIPIAYFEWMNWDIEPDGGLETEKYGMVMHTGRDNMSMISKEKLEQTAEVTTALVFELTKTKLPKTEKGKVMQGMKYIGKQPRNGLGE